MRLLQRLQRAEPDRAGPGELTRLYHPRLHKWTYHFRFQRSALIGRTAIGRTTIDVLQMNHPEIVALRDILMDGGLFYT